VICPICGYEIDSDDYWYGDKCLRCALAEEEKEMNKEGLAREPWTKKWQDCIHQEIENEDF